MKIYSRSHHGPFIFEQYAFSTSSKEVNDMMTLFFALLALTVAFGATYKAVYLDRE